MVFVKIYDAWQVLKRVIPYLIMIPFIIDDVVTYFVILTGKKKTRTYYTLVIDCKISILVKLIKSTF